MSDVYNVTVDSSYTPTVTAPLNDNLVWTGDYPNTMWGNWTINYPTTIYMYQIKCPKCKKNNWLQLDTITPCSKCLAKLKAVSEQAEYEIAIS